MYAESQRLDQQTVDHCLVTVYAIGESHQHLRPFVTEVNKIAERLGGDSNKDFMSMLLTTDVKDEIEYLGSEASGLHEFHKIFKFS